MGTCISKQEQAKVQPRVSRQVLPISPSTVGRVPPSDLDVMRAVVQSPCVSCELKKRPDIYAFIERDLPLFHNVSLEDGGSRPTILLLLNKDDKILKSFDIWNKNRIECNQLLERCGFYRKRNFSDVVPEEYLEGPYKILHPNQN